MIRAHVSSGHLREKLPSSCHRRKVPSALDANVRKNFSVERCTRALRLELAARLSAAAQRRSIRCQDMAGKSQVVLSGQFDARRNFREKEQI